MGSETLEEDAKKVCALVDGASPAQGRVMLAIAGPPASGKSTLAERVVELLNQGTKGKSPRAALLAMDGFHLDNAILEPRGLLARKGAPETFDAAGFCRTVERLATSTDEMFVPRFDRALDAAIANAIPITPDCEIVVVEGNYLLLNAQPWTSARAFYSASVFVSPPMDVLRDRLLARWDDHGLDAATARHKAESNDLPNAELVVSQSGEADLTLTQG